LLALGASKSPLSIAKGSFLSHQTSRKNRIHATTSSMREVMKAVTRIAPSEATVLITGETGTGKEVVARLFHDHSARAAHAFVPINCGAIPETLIESELFGHARGAFTGAVSARKGRIAAAEGGTLFLDEIGELPLSLQVKLLRVLQERSYEPVGSNESVQANFRLVAATNRDLVKEVDAGRFRRDLYYRLMVCPIELASLRDCADDVVELFTHFWAGRGETRPVAAEVLMALRSYPWPGNVRELENVVERISVWAEGLSITLADLPRQLQPRGTSLPAPTPSAPWPVPALQADAPTPLEPLSADALEEQDQAPFALPPVPPPQSPSEPAPLSAAHALESDFVLDFRTPARMSLPIDMPSVLRRFEDEMIDIALVRTNGNKKAAADMLGLQRTTLVEKLRRRNRPELMNLDATGT